MKNKIVVWLVALLVWASLSGCNDSSQAKNSVSSTATPPSSETISQSVVTDVAQSADSSESYGNIDVDLTKLSSTMIYSEVYNMITAPENYMGKTVKMKGQFAVYHDDFSGNTYFAVVIADATACCQQGLEFILGNDAIYPDDYPTEQNEITVQGVFETYQEGEYEYCHLINAKIVP